MMFTFERNHLLILFFLSLHELTITGKAIFSGVGFLPHGHDLLCATQLCLQSHRIRLQI